MLTLKTFNFTCFLRVFYKLKSNYSFRSTTTLNVIIFCFLLLYVYSKQVFHSVTVSVESRLWQLKSGARLTFILKYIPRNIFIALYMLSFISFKIYCILQNIHLQQSLQLKFNLVYTINRDKHSYIFKNTQVLHSHIC